jgi:hypothetical protein
MFCDVYGHYTSLVFILYTKNRVLLSTHIEHRAIAMGKLRVHVVGTNRSADVFVPTSIPVYQFQIGIFLVVSQKAGMLLLYCKVYLGSSSVLVVSCV